MKKILLKLLKDTALILQGIVLTIGAIIGWIVFWFAV